MLADAVFAEGYRFVRNRAAVFWSVVFVPVMGLLFTAVVSTVLKIMNAALMAKADTPPEVRLSLNAETVDLGQALLKGVGDMSNPVVLLFILIGAATLYAGDYRWETWRLISARNNRDNLIVGKVGVLKLLTLTAMAALIIGLVGENLIKALIMAKPLAFTFAGDDFGRIVGLFFLSYWRIVQFAMISLLAAVMTRSLLAALIVPLVVGVAQFFSPQILAQMGLGPDSWLAVLINPGAAADILRAVIVGGPGADMLADGVVTKAVVSLLFWMLAPLVGAVVWFRRQDLSKE